MAKIDKVQEVRLDSLKPYEKNAKVHGQEQVNKIADSIREFGFLSPLLIDKDYNIIAGHGRVMAAKQLGMETVPAVFIEGLTETQRRAYILADNKLTELGGWDMELVEEELKALKDLDFNIDLTGFDITIEDEIPENGEGGGIVNPTLTLPESRLYITAISAFGTNTERFIEVKLSQETADRILKRVDQLKPGELTEKLVEALNGL